MCANSEGSGDTVRMRLQAIVFAVRLCDDNRVIALVLVNIEMEYGRTRASERL